VSPFDPTDHRSLARRADVYALAFEEAGQALAYQERIHADLRARGGGLATTAAVTMSIFGGPAIGDLPVGPALYVAVVAFVGVCLCTLALHWPLDLELTVDADRIIPSYAEARFVPLPLVHRDLAIYRTKSIARNRRTLDRLTTVLRIAVGLLGVECTTWVVNYALHV
jgi:hypothetical protein